MKLGLRTLGLSTCFAVALSLAGAAHADTITGTIWNGQAPYPATLSPTAPTTTPFATFTASSFNFDVPGNGSPTIAGFLGSGSGQNLVCTGGGTACGSATNLNDTYEFTGDAYLVAGQTYSFTHDDGMYLYLDGSSTAAISSGAPTTAKTDSFTVASTGDYSFEVLYTNVNALPAVLTSSSNFTPIAPTPEPGSLVLLGSGLLAAAGAARRKLLSK